MWGLEVRHLFTHLCKNKEQTNLGSLSLKSNAPLADFMSVGWGWGWGEAAMTTCSVSSRRRFCHGLYILSNHSKPRMKLKLLPNFSLSVFIYGNLGRPLSEAPHASVSIWRKLNTNKKDHLTCFLQFQGEFHNSHFCWMIPEGNFLPTKAQIYRFIGALLRGQIIQINWAKVAFTEHQRFNSRQWKGFLMHADFCTQL